jgi:hypothetical protein
MSMQSFIDQVRWQNDHKHDIRINAKDITVLDDGRVKLMYPDEIATPTNYFLGQMRANINETFKPLNLSAEYWNKCLAETTPDGKSLLALNANQWLGKMESRHLVRTFKEDKDSAYKARAFLSNKYARIDNFNLLVGVQDAHGKIVQPGILPYLQELQNKADFVIRSVHIGDDGGKMFFKFCRPSSTKQFLIPGSHRQIDEIEFGVECGNSEIGDRRQYAIPYSFRWWCENSAGHAKYGIAKNHSGRRIEEEDEENFTEETIMMDDMVIVAKFVDIVKAAMADQILDQIMADIIQASGIQVARPSKAVEVLKVKGGLSNAESDAVLAAFVSGNDPAGVSLYGLANAVTAVAKNVEVVDDYQRRSDLEKLGGSLMSLDAKEIRAFAEAR